MINFMLVYICCQVTRLSVDETEQAIKTWCYIPLNNIFYGGHLSSHVVFCKTTRHHCIFNINVLSNRINIRKLTMYTKYKTYTT